VANVDATFKQQVLDLPKGQWKADIHHHRQADNLRRGVKIAEGILHLPKLQITAASLQAILL